MNISISVVVPEGDSRAGAELYNMLQAISPAQCEALVQLNVDDLVELAEGVDAFRTQ